MKKLALFLLSLCWFQSAHAVEIYSAGRHFESIEEYRQMNEPVVPVKVEASLPKTQEVSVLSPSEQKMQKLSYNQGVSHVVVNFEQNWKNPKPRFVAGAQELEQVIKEAMKDRQEATLIVSDPQKLRILSYDAKLQKLVDQQHQPVDKIVKK